MNVCNCTLPYTNPDACKGCPNNTFVDENSLTIPNTIYPEKRNVKRITKTIEKFDENGKFIGREIITTEEENYEKEVWNIGKINQDYIVNNGLEFNPNTISSTSLIYNSQN